MVVIVFYFIVFILMQVLHARIRASARIVTPFTEYPQLILGCYFLFKFLK